MLARTLGRRFVDLDDALAREWWQAEDARPTSIPSAGALLVELGQTRFRDLEQLALERLVASGAPLVIATGGGCIERAASRRLLRDDATCVWLTAPSSVLVERLQADDTVRPALGGGDPASELPELAERRAELYREVAQHVVATEGRAPLEVCARVAECLDVGSTGV